MFTCSVTAEPLHVVINGSDQFNNSIGNVDLGSSTANLTEIEIDQGTATPVDLATVLEASVGLQTQQSGGLGSFSTASLRAASSEQVLIFLDGILLNDAVSGYVDLSLIPVNQIQRIEVFRGSTPVELGAASIGGAINLITQESIEDTKTIGISAGSYGASQLNFHWIQTSEKNQYRIVSQFIKNNNKYPITNDNGTELVTSDDRIEDRNNAETSQNSILFTNKYLINSNSSWLNNIRLFDKIQHLPNFNNSPEVSASLDTLLVQVNSKLNLDQFITEQSSSSIELYLRGKEETYDDRNSEIGLLSNHLLQKNHIAGIKLFNKFRTEDQYIFNITFDTNLQKSLSVDLFNVLSDVRHQRNSNTINFGLRKYLNKRKQLINIIYSYEHISDRLDEAYDVYENPVSAQNRKYHFNDIRLGYLYFLTETTQIKLNIGEYHRVPYLYELYGDRGFFHGNEELKAEFSDNLDLGLHTIYESESSIFHQLRIYSGIFRNKSKDLIVRTYNSQGVGASHNIADAIIQGIEADASLPVLKNHILKFNLSITDSTIISDSQSFDGNIIPGQFTESYALSYNYSKYAWFTSIELSSKKGMFYDRANLLRAKDRELADATVRYSLHQHKFEFSIKNIFNKKYEDYNGYPKPGRILYLAYNFTF